MKEIYDLKISEMPGLNYSCSCGRTHAVGIKDIIVEQGALCRLPDLLHEYKSRKILVIADKNTYKVAGDKIESMLQDQFIIKRHIFEEEHFVPDEKALGRLLVETNSDIDLMIAIGSGSINDVVRYISYKLEIPYIIVCTAPSMDGYASVVSPLIVDGVKITYNAVYPKAIVADIDIMKDAPMKMLHAGLGDIIGKYTALADWQLARSINQEYYCTTIAELVMMTLNKCIKASTGLNDRHPETIRDMTEALLFSGLAIGMTGTSRPASGEEHHLSHCWEMMFMDRGIQFDWLHGNNVGVGTGIVIEAYKYLGELDVKQIARAEQYVNFDKNKWMGHLSEVYGKCAQNVIESKQEDIRFDKEGRRQKLKCINENWDEVKRLCNEFLPEAEKIRDILRNTGAVTSPVELGIDRNSFLQSFIAAKDIRKRYGVFQLLEDMGKLEEAACAVADIYYS